MNIIDIHTHGIGDYDTRTYAEDHILKIAEIHGSYGVSAIVLAIYPAAIHIMRENMEIVKKVIELQKNNPNPHSPPFSNNPSSQIIGLHIEGPFLNPSRCGALDAASFIEPTEYNFNELIEGFEDIVRIITIAPEINGSTGLIKKISDMGIIASMGHSDATYAEAMAGFNAGAKGITHIFNTMRGFHHREPGLAGFGLLNQDIYIEVITDPHHLHLKTIELIFKAKNHERIIIVSDTVKEVKTSSPAPLSPPLKGGERGQGIINIHGKLSGGCMAITESSKRLIGMGYNEYAIMECITKNPERYLCSF